MSKTPPLSKIATLLSILAAAVAVAVAGLAVGQEYTPGGAGPRRSVQSDVANAKPLSSWLVVQEFRDSFQKAEEDLATFQKEFSRQNLDESLRGFDSTAVLVLYEDPTGKQEFRHALGLTVPAPLPVKEPLKVERLRFAKAVRHTHVGPYEELEKVHAAVASALHGSRPGWPVVLVLLDDPRRVSRQAIRTQLVVPVERPLTAAEVGATEVAGIQKAVQAARPVSHWVVGESFEGSVTQTGDFLARFLKSFNEQGLGANLAASDSAPFAILYDNPDQQKAIKIEIAFAVKDGTKAHEPLTAHRLEFRRAVDFTHQGDYSQLASVHAHIAEAVRKLPATAAAGKPAPAATAWPVALRLLTDPDRVTSPAAIKTEIIVPIG
jgi:DNA gyrase inhibitor GyrI